MSDYNLTSLARALSQPQMDLSDASSDGFPARLSMQPSRRRKLSSCNSLESVEQQLASPSSAAAAAEARVLVINTGGTIGMTLHDNGNEMVYYCHYFCGNNVGIAGGRAARPQTSCVARARLFVELFPTPECERAASASFNSARHGFTAATSPTTVCVSERVKESENTCASPSDDEIGWHVSCHLINI